MPAPRKVGPWSGSGCMEQRSQHFCICTVQRTWLLKVFHSQGDTGLSLQSFSGVHYPVQGISQKAMGM